MAYVRIVFTPPNPIPAYGFIVRYRKAGTTAAYTEVLFHDYPADYSYDPQTGFATIDIINLEDGIAYEGEILSNCQNYDVKSDPIPWSAVGKLGTTDYIVVYPGSTNKAPGGGTTGEAKVKIMFTPATPLASYQLRWTFSNWGNNVMPTTPYNTWTLWTETPVNPYDTYFNFQEAYTGEPREVLGNTTLEPWVLIEGYDANGVLMSRTEPFQVNTGVNLNPDPSNQGYPDYELYAAGYTDQSSGDWIEPQYSLVWRGDRVAGNYKVIADDNFNSPLVLNAGWTPQDAINQIKSSFFSGAGTGTNGEIVITESQLLSLIIVQ